MDPGLCWWAPEEDSVRIECQHLLRGVSGGHHRDLAPIRGKTTQNVGFAPVVIGHNLEGGGAGKEGLRIVDLIELIAPISRCAYIVHLGHSVSVEFPVFGGAVGPNVGLLACHPRDQILAWTTTPILNATCHSHVDDRFMNIQLEESEQERKRERKKERKIVRMRVRERDRQLTHNVEFFGHAHQLLIAFVAVCGQDTWQEVTTQVMSTALHVSPALLILPHEASPHIPTLYKALILPKCVKPVCDWTTCDSPFRLPTSLRRFVIARVSRSAAPTPHHNIVSHTVDHA